MSINGGRTVSEAIVTRTLAIFDTAAIFGTGVVAMHWDASAVDWHLAGLVVLLGTIVGINFMHLAGAYRFADFARLENSITRLLIGWLCTVGVLFLATRLFEPVTAADGPWAAAWFSGALTLMAVARVVLWRRMLHWGRNRRLGEVVAIVGAGPIAQRLLRDFAGRNGNLRIVGVYDDEAAQLPRLCMGHPIRGTVDDLVNDARQLHIDTVIVALPLSADRQLVDTLNRLCLVPVNVRLCPDAFGLRLGEVQVSHVAGHTFLNAIDRPLSDWRWVAKAVEDRLLGGLILSLISPLLLAIAILIKLDSPGPVFFRQKRYGFNNQLIEVWKFRTMFTDKTDVNAEQLTRRNDPRITRVGAFLRRTSLDELPQFLNVVRGEMSIVGPRPHALSAKAGTLLYQDAVKYYDARHRVKPGITGWAQINGWRGETDTVEQIKKRVEHDLYYIEHWSILLDLKIIFRTIFGGFTGQHAF
ncbi:Undecaprenyl-phosphate glucose phosphotransferase [Enhydrobacter aerosaccus]|uniref:Undecaprenyl-phosphate glucose phosphotransferase n=1 Tax=Enhydrobacter aerosaccus TaxID=225324 RepID=A0A1T4SQG4_9HYPH|nr:undecaprenyl-phosphate glucose phosphotransferase [Enhydrobacter aerosaccus]SKA30432.1 Undecaprenyl-phosphate glucose phosphotransferase [Enhydrobacter aerosaccus]